MPSQNSIERARVAAREKLGTMSPRERGVQKARSALAWTYRWGWSAPSLIDRVCGTASSGLCARLIKAGLMTKTRTAAGGVAMNVPVWLVTLTALGLQEIERFEPQLLPYEFDSRRIRQELIRHDYLIQLETHKRLEDGNVHSFQTPLQLRARSEGDMKQPDVIWLTAENIRVAVELELTAKWGRAFDQFVTRSIHGLRLNPESSRLYDAMLVLSDSPALLHRYREAMQPGQQIQLWRQTKDRKWEEKGIGRIPTYPSDAINFELLS